MAINIDTQDLVNFPGNVKRVTVDQISVVPQGYGGDEKYTLKVATSAYSDIENRTAIQDMYITDFKVGWCKSSGFAGSDGQFSLTSGANRLKVKLDSTVSGTDGNGYYEIILGYNEDGSPTSGEAVAIDMEAKIRELADSLNTADIGYKAAFTNCSVEYLNGKFWVLSGTAGQFYTGSNRTYVDIISGSTNDALSVLGFDLKTSSAVLDAVAINEALVLTNYTTGNSGITINRNIGASDGDCLLITDRTNTDYFQLTGDPVGGTILSFSSTAITNNYTADITKVQVLREQDPGAGPTMWLDTIDKITRHGIKSIVNEIDFSA